MNRQQRRQTEKRPFSNKKGIQLVINRFGNTFEKYEKVLQRVAGKTILHYVEK